MKLTCVVPILNEENNVKNFLEGYVTQTEKFHELIFVDGNSKDKTREIIKEYMKKNKEIKLVICEKEGLPAARNCGLDNATGDYIITMDADWRFLEDNIINIIKENTNTNQQEVYQIIVNYDKKIQYNGWRKYIYLKESSCDFFMLVKRKLCPRWDEELGFGEDVLWWDDIEKLNISKLYFNTNDFNITRKENMNLKKYLIRNMWYGRTMLIYLGKSKNIKQGLRYIVYITSILPIFWFIPFIKGFIFNFKKIKYGIDVPFGLGLIEIVAAIGVSLGFFQWLFGIRHIGRDKQ